MRCSLQFSEFSVVLTNITSPFFSVQEHKFILNGDVRRIDTVHNKVRRLVGDGVAEFNVHSTVLR
jgi:hypothetical protein